ncbi:MAG TPA: metalloregulator ArsR/SmtB family transcription factor [Pseudomonadales bacterium]|nr:metalloregulator ArsR/SmtB family transcription factor [Pseudomonadales bacterium]
MTRTARQDPPGDSPAGEDDALVTTLRACADPTRLWILRLLARDAFAVQELGTMLGLGQATVSHHLKSLMDAQMVAARRDGTHTFYRRALPAADSAGLRSALLAELDGRTLPAALQQGRDAVFEARGERSRRFFDRNAERFDASRDLIAAPEAYLPELAELLPDRGESVLELGPGPGEFLPELAARYDRVTALDVSPEMIERARRRCADAGLARIELHVGELPEATAPLADAALARALQAPFTTIVCAMVLHHAPRPDALIRRCAARLAPGGQLVLADLCPHGQDWVFDACGDVWPGIDPEAITAWARAAGLEPGPSQFLAQRNGFRIQLRRFEASSDPSTPPNPSTGRPR